MQGSDQHADPAPPAAGTDRLSEWVDLVEAIWPPHHAEGWDAVGLHVGDREGDLVAGVLVTLDVTAAVLDEAAAQGCDLVIAHHPLLFRPLDRLTTATAPGRLALLAARQRIAVVAVHTNLDKAAAGTSHPAATALGLTGLQPLSPLPPDPQVKLVTFAPHAATGAVQAALADAGAGRIGDYEACAFTTAGTGTFRPGPDADPHIGRPGQLEAVAEDRIEVVLPAARQGAVLTALRDAHPYEEVPVDVYPLHPTAPSGLGLGLVGELPTPTPLADLVPVLADALHNPLVRLAATDRRAPVTRVAVVGGAGSGMLDAARRAGAEVLVTGDVSHHVALDALTQGLAVIDAGHWGTEWPAMSPAADLLGAAARDRGLSAPVTCSTLDTDPWTDRSTTEGTT